jgi:primosomal protein N' (replication factor Y)
MRVTQVNGRYRYRLLLKCRGDRTFRDLLRECLERMEAEKGFSGVRVYVDMNNDSDL